MHAWGYVSGSHEKCISVPTYERVIFMAVFINNIFFHVLFNWGNHVISWLVNQLITYFII